VELPLLNRRVSGRMWRMIAAAGLALGLAAAAFAQTSGPVGATATQSATAVPGTAAVPAPGVVAATPATGTTQVATAGATAPAGTKPLPLGYGKLKLGMTRDEVIAELQSDPLFAWRGPEDVSMLPTPNQSLIEVSGISFIRRAFFQFDSGRLWVIILELADDRVDHYGVWTSLVAKYGQPTFLDPSASTWEDGKVRMSLERPLTLRYLDLVEFAKIKGAGAAKVSVEELDRLSFLGGL